MFTLNYVQIQYSLCAIALLLSDPAYTQDTQAGEQPADYHPGKYVPELHGADRGKYVPDHRGQYQHIHVPYDGGYGDRGLKYEHDIGGFFLRPDAPFVLGPRDHLRFMVDFNYDGNGWQVIRFEWVRDGEEDRQVNYVNENRLWESPEQSVDGSGESRWTDRTSVHVDGEYLPNRYNDSYADGGEQMAQQATEIQDTIRGLLEYIQMNILPMLI